MKKELSIVIGLISIIVIVIIGIVIERFIYYGNLQTITDNPFDTVEILGEKIRFKDNVRTYETELDCSSLTDPNTQIFYYRLSEKYLSSKISVSTKVFSNNTLLTAEYKNITDIDTIVSIVNPKEDYEQIYHFNAKCKIDDKKEEEQPKNNDDSNKSTNNKKKK